MKSVDEIRVHAEDRPEHPALVLEGPPDVEVSYAELWRKVAARSRRLARAGVGAGDRCGLQASDAKEFLVSALAIFDRGACLAPVPAGIPVPARERMQQRLGLHYCLQQGGSPEPLRRVDPGGEEDRIDSLLRSLAPAYLRYTSGTTGTRKGVLLAGDSVDRRLEVAQRALRIRGNDRILWVLDMAHHFVVSVLLYLRNGATLLLPRAALPQPTLAFAERAAATFLYASPHHYRRWAADLSSHRLDSVRLAISTTAALPESVATGFRRRFDIDLVQCLGIIEVGLPILNLESRREKPTALGRPLPDFEVLLRDDSGRRVDPADCDGPGRSAELCLRGPGLFDAYLDPWLPVAELLRDSAFSTGDQVWMDAEGDLHMLGRSGSRIEVAGLKFFAEEVERVICDVASVGACRVRGVPHHELGAVPVAEVVPADPARPPDPGQLRRLCRDALPAYMVPRCFSVVRELPHTATGKLRRWDVAAEPPHRPSLDV